MPQPGHIAHVVLSLDTGGLERLVCALVRHRHADDRVTVICLDRRGSLAPVVESLGASVVVVPRRRGPDPLLVFRLARVLRGLRPTVVHTHSLDPMLAGGVAAWLSGVPVRVHTQHNTMIAGYLWRDRLKFRLAAPWFHTIVSVSAATDDMVAAAGIPPARRRVILNGVETTTEAVAAHDTDRFVVGTVARLAPEKGLPHLLAAAEAAAAGVPNLDVRVVGDGPERAALEEAARRSAIAGRVRFLGDRRDVAAELAAFDLFVLPSLTEGIPLSLLEAMAAGLPVVATAVGGVPGVITDGVDGVLVRAGDPPALQHAIEQLAADPERRRALGERARETVRARFDAEVMSREYRWLYLQEPERPIPRAVRMIAAAAIPQRLLFRRGSAHAGGVALTFDDGPDPASTPAVLDVLRRYGIRATFFLIGARAAAHPDLVEAIARDGHEIGNHSQTHAAFDRLSWRDALREVRDAEAVIQAGGRRSALFRPPRGVLCARSLVAAWLQRMTVVTWSIDPKDFQDRPAGDIVAAVERVPLRAGDVILYHGLRPAAIEALPAVIESALRRGGRCVPVSELMTA